jgi:hypothetical protein
MVFWLEMTSIATASLLVFTVAEMFWPETDRAAAANTENARIGRQKPRRRRPIRPKSADPVEKKMDRLGTALRREDKLPNILDLAGFLQRLDLWLCS